MMQRIPSTLKQWWQRVGAARPSSVVAMPLLPDDALAALAQRALTAPLLPFGSARLSTHTLIGELPSRARGRGFEFEENRPYQAGDEPRLLNWRLYARTGQLYTRVYNEERRTEVLMIVDRRAGMRFATTGKLKVTQAATLAAYLFYQARRQLLPVGGVILECDLHWYAPVIGETANHAWFRAMNAPCPPLGFDTAQPAFDDALRMLGAYPGSGRHIVLLSDFADLDVATAQPLLAQLAARHTVQAIRITDGAEHVLPSTGEYLFDDPASDEPVRVDGRDADLQRRFRERAQARAASVHACFEACGIALDACATTDDAIANLDLPRERRRAH
jgi:uncharacterized protein (DUF58 family)